MPKAWYLAALVILAAWAAIVCYGATVLPWNPAVVGFIGTVFTLLPTAIEIVRRLYLANKPATPPPNPLAGGKRGA